MFPILSPTLKIGHKKYSNTSKPNMPSKDGLDIAEQKLGSLCGTKAYRSQHHKHEPSNT